MKGKMFILATALVVAGSLSLAYAADIDNGKALFESPTFGGGTTGKTCMTCHPGGEGLGNDLFEREEITIMGMKKNRVEEVVNVCIENPMGGSAIDTESEEMQDVVAYMKTLVDKKGKKKTRRKIEGC
ncbi:MAG: hypothetical protein LC633_09465 [Desulfobulbaceae bacterium]|nr:hypothetical protein [Desulfobulbaceae bacterium]